MSLCSSRYTASPPSNYLKQLLYRQLLPRIQKMGQIPEMLYTDWSKSQLTYQILMLNPPVSYYNGNTALCELCIEYGGSHFEQFL
jgi:hypothetical protein